MQQDVSKRMVDVENTIVGMVDEIMNRRNKITNYNNEDWINYITDVREKLNRTLTREIIIEMFASNRGVIGRILLEYYKRGLRNTLDDMFRDVSPDQMEDVYLITLDLLKYDIYNNQEDNIHITNAIGFLSMSINSFLFTVEDFNEPLFINSNPEIIQSMVQHSNLSITDILQLYNSNLLKKYFTPEIKQAFIYGMAQRNVTLFGPIFEREMDDIEDPNAEDSSYGYKRVYEIMFENTDIRRTYLRQGTDDNLDYDDQYNMLYEDWRPVMDFERRRVQDQIDRENAPPGDGDDDDDDAFAETPNQALAIAVLENHDVEIINDLILSQQADPNSITDDMLEHANENTRKAIIDARENRHKMERDQKIKRGVIRKTIESRPQPVLSSTSTFSDFNIPDDEPKPRKSPVRFNSIKPSWLIFEQDIKKWVTIDTENINRYNKNILDWLIGDVFPLFCDNITEDLINILVECINNIANKFVKRNKVELIYIDILYMSIFMFVYQIFKLNIKCKPIRPILNLYLNVENPTHPFMNNKDYLGTKMKTFDSILNSDKKFYNCVSRKFISKRNALRCIFINLNLVFKYGDLNIYQKNTIQKMIDTILSVKTEDINKINTINILPRLSAKHHVVWNKLLREMSETVEASKKRVSKWSSIIKKIENIQEEDDVKEEMFEKYLTGDTKDHKARCSSSIESVCCICKTSFLVAEKDDMSGKIKPIPIPYIPVNTRCCHLLCKDCKESYVNTKKITCPVCKTGTGFEEL